MIGGRLLEKLILWFTGLQIWDFRKVKGAEKFERCWVWRWYNNEEKELSERVDSLECGDENNDLERKEVACHQWVAVWPKYSPTHPSFAIVAIITIIFINILYSSSASALSSETNTPSRTCHLPSSASSPPSSSWASSSKALSSSASAQFSSSKSFES